MIDQQLPPTAQGGMVKWVRENLFSSVPYTILTLVCLWLIYSLLAGVLPWLLNGVWDTANIRECREVLDGATGACFSVLSDRWRQLLFGIAYPQDAYWRPTLAFVLLFVAAAPVMFQMLPRKLLIVTILYPFVAFWLIWGGAFWLPILVMAGFAIAYLVFQFVLRRSSDGLAVLSGIAAFIVWFAVLMGLVNTGLNQVVGSARMETKLAEANSLVASLPAEISELENEQESLNAAIAGVIDPLAGASSDAWRDGIAAVADQRRQLRVTSKALAAQRANLSNARSLSDRIERLPALEDSLPLLRETSEQLTEDLPSSVAGVLDQDALETLQERNRSESLGITPEEFGQAEAALKAQAAVNEAERGVSRTYEDVARIGFDPVPSRDMGGFMLNMILGVVCVSLSLPLGIALALGRQSSLPIIKSICVIFIEFVRGVPLITLLFVANVVLAYFLPPGTNFDLILRVIIMITLFSGAYIAEVIRGGLAALPRGQYEAADSLGLDYAQAMRLIILPQALKISIPGIVNVAVGLFKDTVLVSVISMFDLVGMIRGPILASTDWNGVYWELWLFASALFFVVCYGISQYSQWLERQLSTGHK
jgi:His/Glu/Gln/Arg/opine family amino acid ABC transporter permease subunit